MSPTHFSMLIALAMLQFSTALNDKRRFGSSAGIEKRAQALEQDWEQELNGSPTPISRVVKLLQQMQDDLQKEKEDDQKLYDDMKCWCQRNNEDKRKEIDYDKTCIRKYTAEIEERSAAHGMYEAKIPELAKEYDEVAESLRKGNALRDKEKKEYGEKLQELSQAATNAKNAAIVLKKHSMPTASFMQPGSPLLASMQAVLRDLAIKSEILEATRKEKGEASANTVLLHLKSQRVRTANSAATTAEVNEGLNEQNHILMDALNARGGTIDTLPLKYAQQSLAESVKKIDKGAFLQTKDNQPNTYKSYASSSGVVLGILQEMAEGFQRQLEEMQEDEKKAQEDYWETTNALEKQLAALKAKIDQLTAERARNLKKLDAAKINLKRCYKEEEDDTNFHDDLITTCQNLDRKWQERSAMRSEEMLAVSEALSILTEDYNRAHLYKSYSFLQMSSAVVVNKQTKAFAARERATRDPDAADDDLVAEWNNHRTGFHKSASSVEEHQGQVSRISNLATHVQRDSFVKVKLAMDKMIANLKQQQADEVKFKDGCVKKFNANEKTTNEKTVEKEDLEAELADLAKQLKKATQDIAEAKTKIAEANDELQKAGAAREEENAVFQETLADQAATQDILTKVVQRLKDFYRDAKGGKGASLLQTVKGESVTKASRQPTPKQFGAYKTHGNASPVIGLLEQLITDSRKMIVEAKADEASAQADYVTMAKGYSTTIKAMNDQIMASQKLKGETDWQIGNKEGELDSTNEELKSLAEFEADLHSQCDFVMKNFMVRQKARMQEIEAIQAAKANLDGGTVVTHKDCSDQACPLGVVCDDFGPLRQVGNKCCTCPEGTSVVPLVPK